MKLLSEILRLKILKCPDILSGLSLLHEVNLLLIRLPKGLQNQDHLILGVAHREEGGFRPVSGYVVAEQKKPATSQLQS